MEIPLNIVDGFGLLSYNRNHTIHRTICIFTYTWMVDFYGFHESVYFNKSRHGWYGYMTPGLMGTFDSNTDVQVSRLFRHRRGGKKHGVPLHVGSEIEEIE